MVAQPVPAFLGGAKRITDYGGPDAPFQAADPIPVDTIIVPGTGFGILAASSGNVRVQFQGGQTFTFPVLASGGYQILPFAIVAVLSVGTTVVGPDGTPNSAFFNHY